MAATFRIIEQENGTFLVRFLGPPYSFTFGKVFRVRARAEAWARKKAKPFG